MITLPTLPTDNLYKFLFVFGIILIVASGYFTNEQLNRQKNELVNKNVIYYKLLNKNDSLQFIFQELLNSKNAPQSNLELAQADKKIRDFSTKNNQILTSLKRELEKDFEVHKINNTDSVIFMAIYVAMFFIGLFLMYYGAYNWYSKSQIIQDKILRLQLEQLHKELNSKPKIFGRPHFESKR